MAENIPLKSQAIALDVFSEKIEKVAEKEIQSVRREDFLNISPVIWRFECCSKEQRRQKISRNAWFMVRRLPKATWLNDRDQFMQSTKDLLAEVKTWKLPMDIGLQLERPQEDRFAALWLKEHRAEISVEGAKVLAEGRRLYKIFYELGFLRDEVKYF